MKSIFVKSGLILGLLFLFNSLSFANPLQLINKENLASYHTPYNTWGLDYYYSDNGDQEISYLTDAFHLGMTYNQRNGGYNNYFLGTNFEVTIFDLGIRLGLLRPYTLSDRYNDENLFYSDFSLSLRSNDIFSPYIQYDGVGLPEENHYIRYGINLRPFASPNFEIGVEFQDSIYAGNQKYFGDSASLRLSGRVFDWLSVQFESPLYELHSPKSAKFSFGFPIDNLNFIYQNGQKNSQSFAFKYRQRNPLNHSSIDGNFYKIRLDQSLNLIPTDSWFDEAPSLLEWVQSIENLIEKEEISALWIDLNAPLTSAKADQLSQVIKKLKAQKIPTWLSVQEVGANEILLSTAVEKFYLHPQGHFTYMGSGAEVWYYKELLDSIGLEFQVIRAGEYKNAMEPFVSDTMTSGFKSEALRILNNKKQYLLSQISERGKVNPKDIEDHFLVPDLSPATALKRGYVDGLMSSLQIEKALKKDGAIIKTLEVNSQSNPNLNFSRNEKIAVLPIMGTLVNGPSGQGLTGGSYTGDLDFEKQIKQIKASQPDALLLIIESPGGSVIASEKMRDQLLDLKEELNIPIYASVQGMAASGATLLLTAVDKIYVLPNSITGSIGVFLAKPTAGQLLKKIGINSEEVELDKHANAWSLSKNFSAIETLVAKEYIDSYYERFTHLVMAARNISIESMDTLAQGRVYTGVESIENKLADEIGGYSEAIDGLLNKINSDRNHYQLTWYNQSGSGIIGEWALKAQVVNIKLFDTWLKSFKTIEASEWFHQGELISWSPWLMDSNF